MGCKPRRAWRTKAGIEPSPVDPAIVEEWTTFALLAELAIAEFRAGYGLTDAETRILRLLVHGTPRICVAGFLERGEDTIKTQVKTMLHRTGDATMADLVWRVHMAVRND